MDKKQLAILIAAIFAAALVLSGCGNDQRVQAQPDGKEGAAAKAEREAEEAAAKTERETEEAEKKVEVAEEKAEEAREEAEGRASEDASAEVAGSSEGSGEGSGRQQQGGVTLEMEGEPGTEFSGSCAVGDQEEEPIAGRVPRAFQYRTDGEELDCRIRNESGGDLEVVLASGNDRSVQSVDARGATIELTYSDDGLSSRTTSSSSSSSSSGGGGGGSGSSESVSSSSSFQSSSQSGGGSSRQSSHQSSRQVVSSE